MFETIVIETVGPVATVILDRPEKRNALSRRMIDELTEAAHRLGADDAVRVVVLTGQGDVFCAGGDLDWMREQMAGDADMRAEAARALAGLLGVLDALPKPLIGRVNGAALGGGAGLVATCDQAVASVDAEFGFTEARLGLIPATIGPYVVPRIGVNCARRTFPSGRRFDAAEAADMDLITTWVEAEDLDAAVQARVDAYLEAAPGAAAAAKALARKLGGAPTEVEVEQSIAALVERWESEEAVEGIAAFFERRRPAWSPHA